MSHRNDNLATLGLRLEFTGTELTQAATVLAQAIGDIDAGGGGTAVMTAPMAVAATLSPRRLSLADNLDIWIRFKM